MPLLEKDALTVRDNFDALPEDAKPVASQWLRRYAEQQDEFGSPLFPSESAQQQEQDQKFQAIFANPKALDSENGLYAQADTFQPGKGDELRAREANTRFLQRAYSSAKPDDVRKNYELYRDDFAVKQAQAKPGMSDAEFFSLAKKHVENEASQAGRSRWAKEEGFKAALSGAVPLETLAQNAMDRPEDETDNKAFFEGYSAASKVVEKHRPLIRSAADLIERDMTGKAEDGDYALIQQAKDQLVDMPGSERRTVIAALRVEADKRGLKNAMEKFNIEQVGESAFRLGANAMTDTANVQTLLNVLPDQGSVKFSGQSIATPDDARRYVRESIVKMQGDNASAGMAGAGGVGAPAMDDRNEIALDAKATELVRDAKARVEREMRVSREWRDLGAATDPVKNVIASTLGSSGAFIGVMALSRGFAAPVLANAYSNIEYNDLTAKFPQMGHDEKRLIAGTSAAIQAGLDFVGVKGFSKFHVGKLLANPEGLTKALIGRAAGNAALSYGVENLVEAGQDITTPALIQALKIDAPGFDWEQEKADFWKGRSDVAIGMIPLTLMGLGVASVNDYQNGVGLLASNERLGEMGILEPARVEILSAAQEGNGAKAESLFREAFKSRSKEVAAEYQAKLDEQGAQMAQVRTEATRLGLLPDITKNDEGWHVTDSATGTKATFKTWDDARTVATEHMNDLERQETERVASMADDLLSSRPDALKGEEVNLRQRPLTLADKVRQGDITAEQAMEAAVASNALTGQAAGMTVSEARAIAQDVFGESQDERIRTIRDAVESLAVLGSNVTQGGVSQSTINTPQGNWLTVPEEVVEGRFKAGIASGRYSKTSFLNWVKLAEDATGEKFLVGMTQEQVAASPESAPRALVEAVSRIVVADVLGRKFDGRRIGAGSISKSLDTQNKEQAWFVAWLKSFRRLFKQILVTANKIRKARKEGKLGDDYDSFVDDLLGTNGQLVHESESAKEADAIANEAANAGGASYSEANPGPNGETFSLSRAVPADASRVVTMPDGAQLVGPTTFSIRAYHGTPHKVDKFSTSKVGTGEGAQAYGWGLYMAASREVAEIYRKQLSGFDELTIYASDKTKKKGAQLDALDLDVAKYLESGERAAGQFKHNTVYYAKQKATKDGRNDVVERLDVYGRDARIGYEKNTGNFYTVELLPNEDEFLDWDKPLSEQSEKVKAALLQSGLWTERNIDPKTGNPLHSGAFIYETHGAAARPNEIGTNGQAASEALLALGIPGIRYLDGNSRDGGTGTSNYVIFDESLVKILEENGKPRETFSLRKFDFSSRLGPAAETLRGMKQAGKAVDFPAIYKAAMIGQSSGMLPLDRLYAEAKKQNPALTEADFGKQIQALYDSGHIYLETGDTPKTQIEALGKFGVKDSLNVPGVYAMPIDAQSQETFSLGVQARGGVPFKVGDRVRSLSFEATVYSVEPRYSSMGYWVVYSDVSKDPEWAKGERIALAPFAKPFDAYSEPVRVLKRGNANAIPSRIEELESLKEAKPAGSQAEESRLPLYQAPTGGLQYKTPKRGSLGGPEAGSLKVGDTINLGGPQTIAAITERDSGFLWFDFTSGNGALFYHGSRLGRASGESFSLRPGDFASRMSAAFSPFQRSPEMRLMVAQVAKERALRLGAEWLEKGAKIRSNADIDREARAREAFGYDERMTAWFDGLDSNFRQTLESEPVGIEDDPLIAAMLDHGKLMSQSTAKKLGKVEAKSGDYDGAPFLPRSWYSKGAGIMPDQMAQAMHDAGLLPDAYPDTLWQALASRLEQKAKDKAAYREAQTAYKEAQKAAKVDARAEAEAWANQAKKDAGSPKAQRDMLKAALRTLDGILAAAPPEVRARVGGYVKLAGLATDEAMLKEIERRIEKLNAELEKWLKKEGVAQIERLFKKAAPDTTAGKRGKGKDADMHSLFKAAEAASKMDEVAVAGELARLDTLLAGDTLTPEQEALAITERGLVELLGDLKHADAGRVFSALDTLNDIYLGGWLKWKLRQIERREERAGMRADFITDTGKSGVAKERDKADEQSKKLLGKLKDGWLSLSSFHEVLSYAFGEKSDRVKSLVDAEREASGQYEDANQALGDELENLFTRMGGSVVKGEKLRFQMSQRTIKTDRKDLSQLEAIQALLMWRQEDGKRHMEGARDEQGKVTSSWSYDQAWIDEVEGQLTPEARMVMAFIGSKYGSEHATLNPLYRERYGVNLPAHDLYAPITVAPSQAKSGDVVDPVSGASISSGSILSPGSLRTRSRSAIAEPEFRDALQVLLTHHRQLEYWKAYYDLAVEASAILGNREVQNAVKAKGGNEAAGALRNWVDAIAQGGFRDASSRLALMRAASGMRGRAAGVALLGRVSTVLVQSTQLAAASVQMPVMAYLRGLSKLLTGNLGWRASINSAFIQRRYKSAPPIVRQAMDGLASAKNPNQLKRLTRHFGNLLSGADAFFTAGTYAILLDHHMTEGRKLGMNGAELETYATSEAERATEQVAQPTRMAARSLAELSSTSPLAKIGWAFASEARQKVALAGWAASNIKNDPARAAKAAFLTFFVGGLLTQVIKNLWREAKGDDDENMWSPQRLLYASTVAPLVSAIPFGSALAGDANMLSNFQRIKSVDFDGDAVDVMRDVDTLISAAGLFSDNAAAVATLSHAGVDAAKVIQNLAED